MTARQEAQIRKRSDSGETSTGIARDMGLDPAEVRSVLRRYWRGDTVAKPPDPVTCRLNARARLMKSGLYRQSVIDANFPKDGT